MSENLKDAVIKIIDNEFIYNIENIATNLSLLSCFDKAEEIMGWEHISGVIGYLSKELDINIKNIKKELGA
ncbi:hypothetical protein CPIN18020_0222 [Campylobacter pinnipediorum subsp. caledonicus]|uniref:hypothetical protein n=1 Tax=Campylobacter pinnipediorum TaxID=1965231 RepID=UPI0009955956|nr:hypothetical protein [Campylobacter pinnipediorum]AQW85469.1 hypothetical protein CPIN18020_0222 [Campylobacter pinnipediorum subsp. caledonicus]